MLFEVTRRVRLPGVSLTREFALQAAAAAAVVMMGAHTVSANPTFIFTNSGTTPASAAMVAGFQVAADRWSANFTNNVTIRINIASSDLGGGILGSTGSTQTSFSYSQVRNALAATATTTDDSSSSGALSASSTFNMLLNRTSNSPNADKTVPYLDNDGDANNSTLRVARANARALGLYSGTGSDASMSFSSTFPFDYNARDGVNSGQFDFVGVAAHEIGHVLGCISGVDVLDTNADVIPDDQLTFVSPMDLFRFSSASLASGNGTVDFTANTTDKFLSVNGAASGLVGNLGEGQVNGSVVSGNRWQASHYQLGVGALMDPAIGTGVKKSIIEADRRLFDIIGWTRDYTWEWTFNQGGLFTETLNWNANGVPGAANDAVFELGAAYTNPVNFNGGAANVTVRDFINRKDTFTFTPNATQTFSVSRNFIVGDTSGSAAALTLGNGILNTVTTQIATVSGSTGTFNYNTGTWSNTGSIYVGGNTLTAGGTGVLNRASSGAFTVGNTLKVWGAGTVNASVGTSNINTLDVSAGGAVNVSGGTLNVTTTVNNGTITRTGGTASLGTVDGTGTLALINAGTTTASRVRQNTLFVTAGSTLVIPASGSSTFTSAVKSLSVGGTTPTGKIDLNNNFLVLNYAGLVGTQLSNTTAAIKSGRGTANEFGVYTYNGLGITSSFAGAANFLAGFNKFALAAIDNADLIAFNGAGYTTFGGLGLPDLDATSILVRYTYAGDANLDGTINAADYSLINRGFANTIANVGWLSGDFTLDGLINAEDFAVIDFGRLTQGLPLNVGDPVAVPEPTSLALLSVGAISLLRRSRRRI